MEKSRSLTYKILLHKEPEGSYTVTVPAWNETGLFFAVPMGAIIFITTRRKRK